MDTPPNNANKLLSIGEASEYLGISIDTLRRWDKKGKIDGYRSPGGHRYFRKDDLDDLFGTKYDRYSSEPINEEHPKTELENNQLSVENQESRQTNENTIEKLDSLNSQEKEAKIVIPKMDNNITEYTEEKHIRSEDNQETTTQPISLDKTNSANTDELNMPATNTLNEIKPEVNLQKSPEEIQNTLIPQKVNETGMLDNQQLNKLHNILEDKKKDKNNDAKQNKSSRGYKLAVTAIAIFVIIDVILVLALLSAPKVISPVP